MAYCSASDVASLTVSILGSEDTFSTSTCPTSVRLNAWMSSGCGVIETYLGSDGYTTPPAVNTAIYDVLRNLNALYAAAYVELSRTNVTLGPGERTRGQYFLEEFWRQLKDLSSSQNLTHLGLSRSGQGAIYAGGTRVSEKQVWERDSGRVSPRFFRGLGRTPGTLAPGATTAS